jgi:hypothetical protein
MSVDTSNDDTENHKSVGSKTTDNRNDSSNDFKSHFQQGGRHYLIDPDTDERVSVSRLTAYAEYGKQIHARDAHHEIPLLKVDAPKFLDALTREEHTEYHKQEPDPVEVGGFPVLRAGQ